MPGWYYEKYENYEIQRCPMDDKDGAITGRLVLNLPKWFDENPAERIRLGWIKHITHDADEVVDYDPQTQFLSQSTRQIDDYTVEDEYHVLTKSEEQLLFEEMLDVAMSSGSGFFSIGGR